MVKSKLKALHICSGYAKQHLYGELISNLAMQGVEQFVYVPVRSAEEINRNRIDDQDHLNYRFSHILRKHHRIFFRNKIRTVVNDLLDHTDPSEYSLCHAHFLYSDGAIARRVHKATGLSYIVAVRNTDINVFMKLRPDLRWICWDILRNAARVIFVTPSYRQILLRRAPAKIRQILETKSEIIPNGLAPFWLEPPTPINQRKEGSLRLLYVGDFSRNKNIIGAMKATRLLNSHSPTSLTLVGARGDGEDQIDRLLTTGEWPFVKRIGRVDKRDALRDIYRYHDIFLMPSFFETFGLSYIEALSQGLPVVHSKSQGIDGYFAEGTVAEAVDPSNPAAIADGVSALADRLADVKALCIAASKNFAWSRVADSYYRIYRKSQRSRED